jgi:general stress protein YciG
MIVGEEKGACMAARERRGGARGFASMDDEKKRRIASQGGKASAEGKNTANRGFASMDRDKQREISSLGGKASGQARRHHTGDVDEDTTRDEKAGESSTSTGSEIAAERETSGLSEDEQRSLSYSETDEDEDEGLGDGNLQRSVRGGARGD